MALANFLGKSALSASQVLKDFNYDGFQQILLSHRIRMSFDKKTVASAEGFACADLLVRLLARLYPNLHLHCTDGKSPELDQFNELAMSVNPFIDLSAVEPTVAIIIGDTNIKFSCTQFYIGSDQWLAKFSLTKPQLCGNSINRFGAGAAACFAAANLFRHVFSGQLPAGGLDDEFIYSCFNGSFREKAEQGPAIKNVDLDDTVFIGLGAIGNGATWALKDLPLSGSLHLVDGQKADPSNLQRYVLTTQDDIEQPKVNLINRFLNHPAVKSYPFHFDEYIINRGNWNISRAVVCVDTAEDRRMVQGSLPKRIINAWTQAEQCGVSHHYDFLNDPCLACIYIPQVESKSLPMKVAESFGFSEEFHIRLVRDYMANQRPVDEGMINLIARFKNVHAQLLKPYIGKRLETFYAEVICGGVMMELTGGSQQKAAEVPSAFESAFSGILLAAELVIDCGGLHRKNTYTIHKLNLLRPVTGYTFDSVNKQSAPGCICHDPVYRNRYADKWNVKPAMRSVGETKESAIAFDKVHIDDRNNLRVCNLVQKSKKKYRDYE